MLSLDSPQDYSWYFPSNPILQSTWQAAETDTKIHANLVLHACISFFRRWKLRRCWQSPISFYRRAFRFWVVLDKVSHFCFYLVRLKYRCSIVGLAILGGFKNPLVQKLWDTTRVRISSEIIRGWAQSSELQAKSRRYRPKIRITAPESKPSQAEKVPEWGFWVFPSTDAINA